MNTMTLTEDAKVILMLCGRFDRKNTPESARPLSLREYNRLADWLRDRRVRPAALLTDGGGKMLAQAPAGIDPGRIGRLLARGSAMAFAIERWTNAGVWVVCRSDPHYPQRLKRHLKRQAPPILYGIGDIGRLDSGGLAVVGSRNVDVAGEEFTRAVAAACAGQGIQIVSGGARGVDQAAMLAALEAGGSAVGVLADSLLRSAVNGKYRDHIRQKRLVLVSAFSPDARFYVSSAMGRNKHIYALADFALVISAEKGQGGTWAGATEELKRHHPRPVFVRFGEDVPEGNRELIPLGALPFPSPPWEKDLAARLSAQAPTPRPAPAVQQSLFGGTVEPPPAAAVKENTGGYAEQPQTAAATRAADIFAAVLPLMLDALSDWKTPKDLAAELDVRKPQLDDWLKQAVAEGRVERRERPVRYRRGGQRP